MKLSVKDSVRIRSLKIKRSEMTREFSKRT